MARCTHRRVLDDWDWSWRNGSAVVLVAAMAPGAGAVALGPGLDEHPVGSATGVRDIFAVDLDGDGDVDIVVGSEGDNTVGWFANNGDGTFGARNVISSTFSSPDAVHAADLDGDGDLDVIGAARVDRDFSWWENDGSGVFGPEQLLHDNLGEPSDVIAADLDGDQDLDIIAAWRGFGADVGWFRNEGGSFSALMPTLGIGMSETRSLSAADVDGDGHVDILYTQLGAEVHWARNVNGDGLTWTLHAISGSSGGSDVIGTDLDADGDVDVVVINDNDLTWWRSDGAASPSFVGTDIRELTVGRSVLDVDYDGDGDLDLISGHGNTSNVDWHENDGGVIPTFTTHVVSQSGAPSVQAVVAGNFDGDCDVDIAAGVFFGNEVTWFENDSPAVACSPVDLASPFCQLDFSDVIAFLNAFGANEPAADLAAPMGQWDFSDVIAFLLAFGEGCPSS